MENISQHRVFGATLFAFAFFLVMSVFATPVEAAPPAENYKPGSQMQLAWYRVWGGWGPRWGGYYGPRPIYYNGPRCVRICWVNPRGSPVCVRSC